MTDSERQAARTAADHVATAACAHRWMLQKIVSDPENGLSPAYKITLALVLADLERAWALAYGSQEGLKESERKSIANLRTKLGLSD